MAATSPPEWVPAPQGLHTHGWCGRVSLHFAEGFLILSFMSWGIFLVSGTSCKSIHVSTEFVTLFGESRTFDNDPWPAFKLSCGCCQRARLGGKHAVLISCCTARLWHSCWKACSRHGRETMSPSSSSSSQAWHQGVKHVLQLRQNGAGRAGPWLTAARPQALALLGCPVLVTGTQPCQALVWHTHAHRWDLIQRQERRKHL